MKTRTKTDYIVIHCAATRPSQDVGAIEIDRWHRARGFDCIGYHYVICRDGSVEIGRNRNAIGAHAQGYNGRSIGVCMVGGVAEDDFRVPENNFTEKQFIALKLILKDLREDYQAAAIVGHRDLDPTKACPSFDVRDWLNTNHVL